MNQLSKRPIQHIVTLPLFAVIAAGCSGSGGSGDSTSFDQNDVENVNDVSSPTDTSSIPTESNSIQFEADNTENLAVSETTLDDGSTSDSPPTTTDVPDNNDVVPDPLVQNTTRVDFDIVVPAYQSNALQVRLIWGDTDVNAAWVGDAFWSASADLPTNTEQALTVFFNDKNGDITLGTVERNLAIGLNSVQSVSITADEFDTQAWDDDSDGVSNFEELSLGTNPSEANNSAEVVDINVLDSFHINHSRFSEAAATYYEPEIKALELPADMHETEFVDNLPFTSETTVTNVTLTAEGNGTYSQTYDFFIALDMPYSRSSIATRSSVDDTVSWSGTEEFTGSAGYYGAVEHLFDTANTIEGRTLVQTGSGTVTFRRGSWADVTDVTRYSYNFVLDLDSVEVDEETGTTCAVLYGDSYWSFEENIEQERFSESIASRGSSDENWSWSNTDDGETVGGEAREIDSRLNCDFQFNQTD